MKVIGLVKDIPENEYHSFDIMPEMRPTTIDCKPCSESIEIERKTYYSMLWHNIDGSQRIVANDDLVQEIFDAVKEFQQSSYMYYNQLHDTRVDLENYKLKVNSLSFFNRLKYLFTRKID